jgi:hypothetical protein
MPAPPLTNNFEGGTDTTSITTGNSGGVSGDAFQLVTGTVCKFSSIQARGSLSMGMVDTPAAETHRVHWSGLGAITSNVYSRMYLWISAAPAGAPAFIDNVRTTAAQCAGLIITTGGKMQARNAANSAIVASLGTVTLPNAQWIRVEFRVLPSTTVGEFEWKWWSDPTSIGAPDDTMVVTGQVLGTDVDAFLIGLTSTSPTPPWTIYFDDLKIATGDWIGPTPAPGGGAPARPVAMWP